MLLVLTVVLGGGAIAGSNAGTLLFVEEAIGVAFLVFGDSSSLLSELDELEDDDSSADRCRFSAAWVKFPKFDIAAYGCDGAIAFGTPGNGGTGAALGSDLVFEVGESIP